MEEETAPREIAHVLFVDIVGYSTLPLGQQREALETLNAVVRNSESVRAADAADELTRLPTGDGMALVFFRAPTAALDTAVHVATALRAHPHIELRMGLNTGAISVVADVNERRNIAGEGINVAQRVMDFGDGGHILASGEFVRAFAPSDGFHRIGDATAKHGLRIELYNYADDRAGNPEVPQKLRTSGDWTRPASLWLSPLPRNVFRSGFLLLRWLLFETDRWRRILSAIDPRLPADVGVFDLTRSQLTKTPELRQLLLHTYVVWPVASCVIVWLLIAPAASTLHMNAWMEVAGNLGQGLLLATLLGLATGLLFFALNTLATLTVLVLVLAGMSREPASAVATILPFLVIFPVALTRVMPQRREASVVREVLAIVGSFVVGITVVAAVTALSSLLIGGVTQRKASGWIMWLGAAAYGAANFVMVNGIMVMRKGWWSRGFATGQIVAVTAALGWVLLSSGVATGGNWLAEASQQIERLPPTRALSAGFGLGMMQAVTIGLAYALAEKLAGGRAAIIAAACVFFMSVAPSAIIAQNSFSAAILCVIAIIGTYFVLRRRSLLSASRQQASAATRSVG